MPFALISWQSINGIPILGKYNERQTQVALRTATYIGHDLLFSLTFFLVFFTSDILIIPKGLRYVGYVPRGYKMATEYKHMSENKSLIRNIFEYIYRSGRQGI